jgi:hypothetical protein
VRAHTHARVWIWRGRLCESWRGGSSREEARRHQKGHKRRLPARRRKKSRSGLFPKKPKVKKKKKKRRKHRERRASIGNCREEENGCRDVRARCRSSSRSLLRRTTTTTMWLERERYSTECSRTRPLGRALRRLSKKTRLLRWSIN